MSNDPEKMRRRYAAMATTLHSFLREHAHAYRGTGTRCTQCALAPDSAIHMCPECTEDVPLGERSICPECGTRA